jgi:hypothetical protein
MRQAPHATTVTGNMHGKPYFSCVHASPVNRYSLLRYRYYPSLPARTSTARSTRRSSTTQSEHTYLVGKGRTTACGLTTTRTATPHRLTPGSSLVWTWGLRQRKPAHRLITALPDEMIEGSSSRKAVPDESTERYRRQQTVCRVCTVENEGVPLLLLHGVQLGRSPSHLNDAGLGRTSRTTI